MTKAFVTGPLVVSDLLPPSPTIEVRQNHAYLEAAATAPDGYHFQSGPHQLVESWRAPYPTSHDKQAIHREIVQRVNHEAGPLVKCAVDCECGEGS